MKLYTPSLLQRTDSKATLPLKADLKEYDERHPTYLGNWSRSIPPSLHFAQDSLDEPHVKRKLTILAQYPKVTELYGREPLTALITLGGVLIQLYFANYFGKQQQPSIPLFLATAYIIGGTITHVFGVVIHEACHNLIFKSPFANRLVGFLANVGIPFPIAASFKRYHLEHHAFQGVTDKDPDLPLPWEIRFCNGSPVFKFLFLLFYPLMYVIRGAVQQKSPSFWEIVNLFYTIGTDILVYTYCGGWGLGYLGMSLWLGYSIHPGAAHFLQEHFTFLDGQETYSYYGSGNLWAMNIGYHNEHHDFTKIPWTNLPRLRSLASEFYDNCAYHSSWIKVLIDFVFDPTIGPQSRVERAWEAHNAGRRMIGKVNGKEVKEGEDVDEKEEDEKKVKVC